MKKRKSYPPKVNEMVYSLNFGQYVNFSLVKDELDYEFGHDLTALEEEQKGIRYQEEDFHIK